MKRFTFVFIFILCFAGCDIVTKEMLRAALKNYAKKRLCTAEDCEGVRPPTPVPTPCPPVEPTPTPNPTPTPTPPPPQEEVQFFNVGEPTECCLPGKDLDCTPTKWGEGGLLWTPSEHGDNFVLLLPGYCGDGVKEVKAVGENGKKIKLKLREGQEANLSNPVYVDGNQWPCSRLCRKHFRLYGRCENKVNKKGEVVEKGLTEKLGTNKPSIILDNGHILPNFSKKKGFCVRHD